jgi:hypothetical protein
MFQKSSAFALLAAAGVWASSASAQPFQAYASGLLHQNVGSALLDPPVERRLPVRNLGSSGEDGVEVQLHSMTGGGVAVDVPDFTGVANTEIKIKHKGWDGTIKGSLRQRSNGDGTGVDTFDFSSVGVTSFTVTDFDEHGLPISTITIPGPIGDVDWVGQVIQCPPPCSWVTYSWIAWVNGKYHWVSRRQCVCLGTGDPTGGGNGWQNARVITPTFPPGYIPDATESLLVTASGVTQFDVTASELGTFGVASHALGQAHLAEECDGVPTCSPTDRKLSVQNIGSSGQDGVAIDLAKNGGVQWTRRDLCCPSPGHTTLLTIKDANGLEISHLTESPSPVPGEREVSCDFSALGASGVSVTCYDDTGGVIFTNEYLGTAGVTVRGPRCPTGSYWGFNSGSHSWGCITPTAVVLPGGTTVNGVHTVEYRALGGSSTARARSMELTANEVSGFTIENLTVLPVPCVADVDDGSGSGSPDGGVTIDDLLYYLTIFENGDVTADVDDGSGTGTPDGGVTIDDLIYYLTRFEAGC